MVRLEEMPGYLYRRAGRDIDRVEVVNNYNFSDHRI